MQQFYVDTLKNIQLSKEQHNQCKKVLRMRKDDQVRLVVLGVFILLEMIL